VLGSNQHERRHAQHHKHYPCRPLVAPREPNTNLYQWFYGRSITRQQGRGQFLQACEPEALQERLRCGKAQPAVVTGELFDEHEIPEFHDECALVGIEEVIDFCLANRLLKGDAGEHFECRGRDARILAPKVLFTQIRSQCLVVDLRSEKRNHPVDNSELKADQGELPVAGQQRGYQFHVTQRRHGSRFRADLLPEEFPELLTQSVDREALSR